MIWPDVLSKLANQRMGFCVCWWARGLFQMGQKYDPSYRLIVTPALYQWSDNITKSRNNFLANNLLLIKVRASSKY